MCFVATNARMSLFVFQPYWLQQFIPAFVAFLYDLFSRKGRKEIRKSAKKKSRICFGKYKQISLCASLRSK